MLGLCGSYVLILQKELQRLFYAVNIRYAAEEKV